MGCFLSTTSLNCVMKGFHYQREVYQVYVRNPVVIFSVTANKLFMLKLTVLLPLYGSHSMM